jgi:hypothetical protein
MDQISRSTENKIQLSVLSIDASSSFSEAPSPLTVQLSIPWSANIGNNLSVVGYLWLSSSVIVVWSSYKQSCL